MSSETVDWLNAYRLNGMMTRRDPTCMLSLDHWEGRSVDAKAAEAELREARQRLEEKRRKEEGLREKREKESFEAHLRLTTQLIFSSSRQIPSLCEPRSLYHFKRETFVPQVLPRWPKEVSCISDHISHHPYVPKHRESLCNPDRDKDRMVTRHLENGSRLVYFYSPSMESFFKRARVGESVVCEGGVCCKLESVTGNMLLFESRFESGNLQKAVQVGPFEYELWLRCDLYTQKHTQWYYFRVQNMRPNVTYKFTIMNLLKPDSLYNHGMQPLMYSEKKAAQKKIGWHRVGHRIKYYRNSIRREDGKCEQFCYSLTWQCEFPSVDDTCYFAHCYPYTYSDLQEYLRCITQDPIRSQICKQKTLCRTIAGNLVHILTITSSANSPVEAETKRAIVVTARVHPGETNSSWMMKGLLDYLTGSSRDAKILRDNFVFKIIPMLNPDGVIVGNYRCSLTGRDLNRNYRTNLKDSFPSVWYTKQMVKRLTQEREVVLYCDFHGHSRKQNVFIYGCDNKSDPSMRLHERVFPMMMHKNAPTKFSFSDCSFKVQKSKEGTGRIVMWREMGIMNSYTMETTFCGSTMDKLIDYHFSTADLETLGYHFCDTVLDYCDPDRTKYELILEEVREKVKADILAKLDAMGKQLPPGTDPLDMPLLDGDFTSGNESSDVGSDSSVSDGLPVHLLHSGNRTGNGKKKKKRKSRTERNRRRSKLKLHHEQSNEMSNFSSTEPSAVPLTEQDVLNSDRCGKSLAKKQSDKKGVALKLTTVQQGGVPMNTEERLEDRHLRRIEYLESLTDDYIRSSMLITAGSPSSTKLRALGAVTPSVAGLVEDRLSGRVMISGYSLVDKTEDTTAGTLSAGQTLSAEQTIAARPGQARPSIDVYSPPRIRSSAGFRVESPFLRSNSQGPGAFTARYVSHHLSNESGGRLAALSHAHSGILRSALASRPATATHSRTSLIQPVSTRSRTSMQRSSRPTYHISDIVRRQDTPVPETTKTHKSTDSHQDTKYDDQSEAKNGETLAASNSTCSIAMAMPLDKDTIQFLADRLKETTLPRTNSTALVRSGLFKKQLQAVQSMKPQVSSTSPPIKHERYNNSTLNRSTNPNPKACLSPISHKPAAPMISEDKKQVPSATSRTAGVNRLSKLTSAVAQEKAANRERIDEHKSGIAAAVREREEKQQQQRSLTNIKEASSLASKHYNHVEPTSNTQSVEKDKKSVAPRVRKSTSEPTTGCHTSEVRKMVQTDNVPRTSRSVSGGRNVSPKNCSNECKLAAQAVTPVDGNLHVTFPENAGKKFTLQKVDPLTKSAEGLSREPLEPAIMYRVAPKPNAATGTPTPTIDITMETSKVNYYIATRKKMPQLRPHLRASTASHYMLPSVRRQRDAEW